MFRSCSGQANIIVMCIQVMFRLGVMVFSELIYQLKCLRKSKFIHTFLPIKPDFSDNISEI